jgi:hypothetical protein
MTTLKAISPTGKEIIGTLETVPGIAFCTFTDSPTGPVSQYSGETEIDWDGQESLQENGRTLYVDKNGDVWTENQFTFIREDS